MTTHDRFQRIEELFHRALELPEPDRAAFVEGECGGDPEIRAKVERLLELEGAGDALSSLRRDVAASVRAAPSSVEGAGDTVGPYRLLRRLGEGGMGVVFEAEQERPVRRKVALKLIRWGMDTEQVVARFESERQALALMSHPGIARVYDAGATVAGRPYFAMELVEGVPVTTHCDAERLDTRARLDLFLRICDAVQHAHHKGIIHRDLKPSNILVTTEGDRAVPKIIDFGVAKATAQRLTERTVYTELGQLIGTPEYMSPEQAELSGEDVDTRTDVYALGVVLYELLVGALPFDPSGLRQAGFDEIRRRIREEEPSKPSTRVASLGAASTDAAAKRRTDPPTLRHQLRGDLDWIVMKALEKERARRYTSAGELGADLLRHLHHEPVLAGPPTAAYRTRKFVRRHRALVAGAAAVLVVLVGGIVVSTRFAIGQFRARTEAERQARIAEAVAGFLRNDVLAAAGPERTPDRELTVRAALDAASGSIEERFHDEPVVQGSIHTTIGLTYGSLGVLESAERHLGSAVELFRATLGGDHPETLAAINNLGDLYTRMGRYDDAEPLLVEVLETKRRTLGDEHDSTSASINNLGLLYREQGRLEEAEPLLAEGLDLDRRLRGDEDDATLTSAHNLALLYQDLGRMEEAQTLLEKTLDTRRRVSGASHPDTLAAVQVLAVLHGRQGRVDEAVELLRDLVEHRRAVLGDEHPDTLISMSSLATGLSRQGRLDEAASLYVTVIDGSRKALPDHWHLAMMLSSYGSCLTELKRFEDAERVLTESHGRFDGEFGPADSRTLKVTGQLAGLYEAWGRPDDAARWRATGTPARP